MTPNTAPRIKLVSAKFKMLLATACYDLLQYQNNIYQSDTCKSSNVKKEVVILKKTYLVL